MLLLWNLHARSRTSVREAKGGENVPRRLKDDPLGKGQAEEYEVACPTKLQNKQYSSTWRQIMACIVASLTLDTVGNLETRSKGLIEY